MQGIHGIGVGMAEIQTLVTEQSGETQATMCQTLREYSVLLPSLAVQQRTTLNRFFSDRVLSSRLLLCLTKRPLIVLMPCRREENAKRFELCYSLSSSFTAFFFFIERVNGCRF